METRADLLALTLTSRNRHVILMLVLVPKSHIHLRQDEDGTWIAKSKLLPGCHADGRSQAEAVLAFEEAAKAHLKALLESGKPIPEPFRNKFILRAA